MFRRFCAVVALLVMLAACGATTPAVARVGDVTLTRPQLDAQLGLIEAGIAKQDPTGANAPPRADLERDLVSRFVDQYLLIGLARQRNIAVTDAEIDTQIETFRTTIPQEGTTLDTVIREQLGYEGVESTEFRQFVLFFLAQQKLVESLVPEADVRARVTEDVNKQMTEVVLSADVAHILVATEAEATAVIERLGKGEAFAALATEVSTDPGSKDSGGEYKNITKGMFVPEFEQAMFEQLKVGETTLTPVQSQFGYHVIRLDRLGEAPAMTTEEAQGIIEQRTQEELEGERGQKLQELLAAEREKAVAERRLEEPVYPTATPAAAELQPVDPQLTAAPVPTAAP